MVGDVQVVSKERKLRILISLSQTNMILYIFHGSFSEGSLQCL